MIEWFQCLDKEIIPVKECLQHCRMDERCLTLPTLKLVSTERVRDIAWACPNCGKEVDYEH